MTDEPIFKSAHAALSFAFNYQGNPQISFTNRAWKSNEWPGDVPRGKSKGLSGIDGAGQSGLIRGLIMQLGMLHEAIIIAEYAPRWVDCPCHSPCCSGKVMSQEWKDAIAWLADNVRVNALEGHTTDHKLRRACVEVFFKAPHTNIEIAKRLKLDRSSVGVMVGKVRAYMQDEHRKALNGADRVLDCLVIKEEVIA